MNLYVFSKYFYEIPKGLAFISLQEKHASSTRKKKIRIQICKLFKHYTGTQN